MQGNESGSKAGLSFLAGHQIFCTPRETNGKKKVCMKCFISFQNLDRVSCKGIQTSLIFRERAFSGPVTGIKH